MVDAAEALLRGGNDLVAMHGRTRTQIDALDFGAEFFAFPGNLRECIAATGRNDEITTGAGQHLCSQRSERTGRAGDDRGLAFDIEQRQRIFQKIFGH